MDLRPVLARAIPVAIASAAFTTVVQVESFGVRIAPTLPMRERLALGAAIPLVQWQAVVVAAAMGLLVASVARTRATAALGLALFVVTHALVAFDQTAYRLFGEHMAMAQTEGGWRDLAAELPALLGSGIAAGGLLLLANLALLGITTSILARRLRRPVTVRTGRWMAAGAVWLVGGFVVSRRVDARRLDEYPLSQLFASSTPAMPTVGGIVPRDVLYRLRDSTWRDDDSSVAVAAAERVRSHYRAPNVLLIVLESVGSEQLLPGGRFDARVTPRLAARAANAIVLPELYSVYPATTRAHVPLMTGGRTITWGSVSDELTHRLNAPTFVSALKTGGYHTGLFAAPDLRFGSLADFYRTMPWDTLVYYLDGGKALAKKDEIHSWGVNEDAVRPLAVSWADSARSDGRPFFLEFHTIATHHPYGTWGNDRGPATADDDRSRYINSLHYTDAVIGRLLRDLDDRHLLQNTIVAITGDHGEAFAEYHANNYVHRNALFEENVRNFLVLLTPGVETNATVRRLGSQGDVMPTVASLAGVATGDVEGQDLLSPRYAPRIAYFYKDVAPAQSGLRDGRWKYIVRRDGTGAQLFDLATDSTEQRNVAARHPARIAAYRELTSAWYIQMNDEYTARLVGWDSAGRRRVTRRNLAEMSPPQLRVGHFTGEAGEGFVETRVVSPNDKIYVFNRWGFLPGDVPVRIAIVSPSRLLYVEEMTIRSDWDTSWYHPALDAGKEEGRWEVTVWRGATALARTTFEVKASRLRALGSPGD